MKAYLAGPDVFLPNATEHARRKVAICARLGFTGRPPLNEDVAALAAMPEEQAWETIFRKDVAMMEECDVILANLTPFRGVSADSGTLIEVGWFLGRGKPVFAYTNNGLPFARRCAAHGAVLPDPIPGVSVEGFGLPDNLMIAGAVLHGGGGYPMVVPDDGRELPMDSLEMFERCARLVAERLR